MISLGSTIRRLRKQSEFTQEELAGLVGITPSYLSHIESDRKEPRIEVLRRISQELPVWPGLLLGAVVQTEMPEELRPAFEGFVDEVLRASDSTQLPLPLETEDVGGSGGGRQFRVP